MHAFARLKLNVGHNHYRNVGLLATVVGDYCTNEVDSIVTGGHDLKNG